MLIATILSQNTNDKNSFRAYQALRTRYPEWGQVVEAPLRDVRTAIRAGGMANQKAPRIRGALKAVREMYGTYDLSALRNRPSRTIISELTALRGVGPKTAACVLLFSLGRDVFPVDTHVHRLCSRLGLAPGSRTPDETFEAMQRVVPPGKGYSFHTNLIRFGRMVCRSQRPLCGECPVYEECGFPGKDRTRGRRSISTTDHHFMLLDNVRNGL